MTEIFLAFIGSICPAMLNNLGRRNLLPAGICGAVGWFVYNRIYINTNDLVISTFAGAILVGSLSESMARIMKAPASVYSIPGIFPLVPGIAIYNTVQLMGANEFSKAINIGIEAVASSGAIAFGILITSAIFRIFKIRKGLFQKN